MDFTTCFKKLKKDEKTTKALWDSIDILTKKGERGYSSDTYLCEINGVIYNVSNETFYCVTAGSYTYLLYLTSDMFFLIYAPNFTTIFYDKIEKLLAERKELADIPGMEDYLPPLPVIDKNKIEFALDIANRQYCFMLSPHKEKGEPGVYLNFVTTGAKGCDSTCGGKGQLDTLMTIMYIPLAAAEYRGAFYLTDDSQINNTDFLQYRLITKNVSIYKKYGFEYAKSLDDIIKKFDANQDVIDFRKLPKESQNINGDQYKALLKKLGPNAVKNWPMVNNNNTWLTVQDCPHVQKGGYSTLYNQNKLNYIRLAGYY
jgi:hypothetical protein